jgi:fatty acid desaturase
MIRLDLTTFTEKRADAWSALVVAAHLTLVLLPLHLGVWAGIGPHLFLVWLWVGLGMNGLLNLMHECAHYHVFTHRRGSLFLGRWILGPLALADFDAYQKRHWIHHRCLGEGDDPKYVYRTDVHRRRFLLFTLRCIGLLEALKKFSGQGWPSARHGAAPPRAPLFWAARTLLVHLFFSGSLLWVGMGVGHRPVGDALRTTALVYGGVYLYGLASLTVWVASLRAIAEHQITEDRALHQKDAALRNFRSGRVLGWILGSYGFVQHATHHYEPAIPYYRLPKATGVLAESNPAFAPGYTYGRVLSEAIRTVSSK